MENLSGKTFSVGKRVEEDQRSYGWLVSEIVICIKGMNTKMIFDMK